MRYFRRLKQGYDPGPLLSELSKLDSNLERHVDNAPAARSVPLRGLVKSAQGGRARRDVHESRWTSTSHRLPRFQEFLRQIAAEEDSVLARARIVIMAAGQQAGPRTHQGDYFKLRNRFQLILKSASGSFLKAGNEEVLMQEGELWWFDNKTAHEARNNGEEDSIHLVFDLLPRQLEAQVMRASRKARKASLDA